MNFNWWTFALQAVNFLILVWLLQRFLFKPVKAMVARRKQEIAQGLAEAAAQRQSVQSLEQELKAQRAQVEAERQKTLEAARAQSEAEHRQLLVQAAQEVGRLKTQGQNELAAERVAASEQLFERSVALATDLAQRLQREVAAPALEQAFLDRVLEYLDQMAPRERAGLCGSDGAAVLVATASALAPEAQQKWQAELARRLERQPRFEFSTDPSLLAGATLTFASAILRFDWRDALAAARLELNRDEGSLR